MPTIDATPKSEVRIVIRFLQKGRQQGRPEFADDCDLYGRDFMSDSFMCELLQVGQTYVHDVRGQGRKPAAIDGLSECTNTVAQDHHWFTIVELSNMVPKFCIQLYPRQPFFPFIT